MINNTVEIEIIRHAESWSNVGLRTDQPATIPLTDHGRHQAQVVSDSFNGLTPPRLIVVSPFTRTSDTAAPLRARFPQVPVETWPIQEFTHLDTERWRGTTRDERNVANKAYWSKGDASYVDGTGAESFNHLMGRVDSMFNRLSRTTQGPVVLFSHGLFMQAALFRLQQPGLEGDECMNAFNSWRVGNHVDNIGRLKLKKDKSGLHITERWVPKAPRPFAA